MTSGTFGISFFRPSGAWLSYLPLTHGLRRGLYSFAASRLESTVLFHLNSEIRVLTHTLTTLSILN